MKGRIDSGLGQIVIDTDVIATYAGSVAVECFGIIGMAALSMKDGLVKLLRKDSLKHGIHVVITEENTIRLDFHVIVAYGVNISTIADNLISNVKYKVEAFTGMEISKINIYVEGVRPID
ncbi:MAG TPA: Asp23/Gls24 family envelope stress response protein [Candidatus Blautia faecigallinarum]|uniref:Asp23/Gls24 family envelope stress response protein n=1 Tax=Candidatus Blautia faecigallinarum TaxID=2838488 RepID=A0A9D2DUW0_9FIRM|nr:Asp23/Gls24 family envelope stress response protein [Candidatus Blautia faecigallinarum]